MTRRCRVEPDPLHEVGIVDPRGPDGDDQFGVSRRRVGMLEVPQIPVDDGHGAHTVQPIGAVRRDRTTTGVEVRCYLASRRAAFSARRCRRIFLRPGTPST